MAERRLPVGIQSFEKLRSGNYVYVDKTKYIWDLIQNGSVYFLSRPRRFGKSLLLSTMEAYFIGKKELFHGLAIEKYENAKAQNRWTAYPVITFSLSGGEYNSPNGLSDRLSDTINHYSSLYDLTGDYAITGETLTVQFQNLIAQMYRKTGKQVVVLVDEYDKPLLETMVDNEAQEEKNRQLYKSFFSVLKDQDQYLHFVFFTGVTKFSKVSVFSDLNQLKDISLNDDFSGICGITENELKENFLPEINKMADRMKIGQSECVQNLASMYDGYHFSPDGIGVYNPFSLLNAFQDKRLRRYWFETGTPTFLVKKLLSSDFTPEQLTNGVDIDEQGLMDYHFDDSDPLPLFYQTGYLTICGYDEEFQIYSLIFPNKEVKFGFLNSLVPYVLGKKDAESPASSRSMVQDLRKGSLDSFLRRLQALFAGIPYIERNVPDYEQVWRNQIFLILTLLGQNVKCEVHSALGRADCIIETSAYVYILEFKLDKSADETLKQIKVKEYAKSYIADTRKVLLAGINFSSKKKNIAEWKIEDFFTAKV